ncbi:MAG TPA: hypothetical protein VK059_07540 [Nocardioidaceae bacterium]|nr:hypothetical protein [Nocardioidaceae bacterium]
MTIHPELEQPVPMPGTSGRLRVVLSDDLVAERAAHIVENVVGRAPCVSGAVSLTIAGVDGRTAVDVLAELAWASVLPIAFSLD